MSERECRHPSLYDVGPCSYCADEERIAIRKEDARILEERVRRIVRDELKKMGMSVNGQR